jgi:hypothetical protein
VFFFNTNLHLSLKIVIKSLLEGMALFCGELLGNFLRTRGQPPFYQNFEVGKNVVFA